MTSLRGERFANPIRWHSAGRAWRSRSHKFGRYLVGAFAAFSLFIAAHAGAQSPGSDLEEKRAGDLPGWTPGFVGGENTAQNAKKHRTRSGQRPNRRGERNRRDGTARGVRVPPGVRVIPDLKYAEAEGQSLQLDLYLPKESSSGNAPPLLIWIHGGGWTKGDKRHINPVFVRLVSEDYATASINYRLGGVRLHPRQLHDVKGAIRWLRAQADRFGYDGARMALGGGSAGAHLALLAGLTGDQPALEGDTGGNLGVSSNVQAIVDMYGPSDLAALAASQERFARKPPQLLGAASPVNYIDPGDPPLLILHGDQDAVVPVDQSLRLHERYKAAGLVSDLHVVRGAGHSIKAFKEARMQEVVKNFLDRHLRPKQSSASDQQEEVQTLGLTPPSMPASSTDQGQSRIEPPADTRLSLDDRAQIPTGRKR